MWCRISGQSPHADGCDAQYCRYRSPGDWLGFAGCWPGYTPPLLLPPPPLPPLGVPPVPVLVSGGVVGVVSVEPPPAGAEVVGAVVVVGGVVWVGVLWIVLVLALSELEPPQPATTRASASASAPAPASATRRIVVRIRGMIGGHAGGSTEATPVRLARVKLATFLPPGSDIARAGEVRGREVVSFPEGTTVRDLLATGADATADDEAFPLEEVGLLAPVPNPRAIYAIGLNYAAHASETGGEPPESPIVFVKVRNSVAPPAGPVRCPAVVRRLDYEGELTAVIGSGGTVAGYAVADDVSARDLQAREPQWTRAKGADTFCPWGPWVTTADEVGDPEALRLRTWVNGELRQDATTADLIFGIDELVAFLSETHTLSPGDLILTGTPAGVGVAMDPPQFLQTGDVVRIEVEGLGWIEHAVEAAGASAARSRGR